MCELYLASFFRAKDTPHLLVQLRIRPLYTSIKGRPHTLLLDYPAISPFQRHHCKIEVCGNPQFVRSNRTRHHTTKYIILQTAIHRYFLSLHLHLRPLSLPRCHTSLQAHRLRAKLVSPVDQSSRRFSTRRARKVEAWPRNPDPKVQVLAKGAAVSARQKLSTCRHRRTH
jgi:hypothetical protein